MASSVDTAGFAPANGVSATEQILALDSATLPSPALRPSADLTGATTSAETPVKASAATAQAQEPAPTADVAAASPSAPTAAPAPAESSEQTEIAKSETGAAPADTVNQRIASASNAPTVASAASQAPVTPPQPVAVAAAATEPTEPEPQVALAPASEPRKRTGLFAALFNNPDASKPEPKAPVRKAATASPTEKPLLAAASTSVNRERAVIATASARGSLSDLPGVDKNRAMGISEAEQDDSQEYEVASAGGLARLAPNGLKTQHDGVDVKCLKPALVRVLKQVERKYGKAAIVTSGYRSPSHNKRVRGAKKSLHMYCAAADIQVPGVSKWQLASFMRSMPGRGGVGTYFHTNSVHVDIGPRRDWNWRCRRR